MSPFLVIGVLLLVVNRILTTLSWVCWCWRPSLDEDGWKIDVKIAELESSEDLVVL